MQRDIDRVFDGTQDDPQAEDFGPTMTPREKLIETIFSDLSEIEDYFDNRSDVVDGSYGIPEPNAEMKMLQLVRDITGMVRAMR
jgi:hypothetical protein